MRRLMLLRHAKAERPAPGARDIDRPLAEGGREPAIRIGAYMAGHGLVPDLAICSSAKRARQTWELALPAFAQAPRTTYDPRVYELDGAGLLELVCGATSQAQSLLLVGHNPSLEDLADLLIATGDLAGRERLAEKFPTGALAVIDFPFDTWAKLHPHSGRFDRLITPRALGDATE
jgi:phosphohistidine phosphatase